MSTTLTPELRSAIESDPVYLKEEGVTVTRTRFAYGNQLLAMSNIASVRAEEVKPKGTLPGLLFLAGILLAVVGVGWPLMIIALIVGFMQRSKVSLYLSTSAGEVKAFSTKDRKLAERVMGALTQAMIERG